MGIKEVKEKGLTLHLSITKKTVLKSGLFVVLLFLSFFAGAIWTVPTAYKRGFEEGTEHGWTMAITEVNKLEDKTGLRFEWEDLGNGRYELTAFYNDGLIAVGHAEVHIWIVHRRNGEILSQEFGAGTLTNTGKNWTAQQISGTSSDNQTIYCADSNDASAPDAAWTELPSEITSNGLDRQQGTYSLTGTGTWNVTVTKSVTGTQSTQLWGLHTSPDDGSDGNLIAADSTPSQKNCVSGDSLQETWQVTVS